MPHPRDPRRAHERAGHARHANHLLRVVAATLLVAHVAAAQSTMPPGHQHEAPRAPPRAGEPARVAAHPADVRFMQHMIAHHAQALEMSALIARRSRRPTMRLLGERISVSQRDEIRAMQRWLLDRGQAAPDPLAAPGRAALTAQDSAHAARHASHMADSAHAARHAAHVSAGAPMHGHTGMAHDDGAHADMPGMLTRAQLDTLATLRGTAFDRRFLESMIAHHAGAITMVEALFATPGAGQEPQLFGFATDVDADQRAEIARMRALLATLPRTPAPRR
ncbi:MAG: DUF305 domain-containing protein [Gemmatimonadaceae bacterium]|nr:DUF305 domain-containing protein [Gemmatimonadaceae bacterium]